MAQQVSIRNSLSLPMMAQIVSQQLCQADDDQMRQIALDAGIGLVRQWSPSGGAIRQLLHELHLNLQEAVQTAQDPVQSANAQRALKLLESALSDLDRQVV